MSLLLDTHVIIWWLTGHSSLPDDVRTRLDIEPDIHFSSVSVWEVTIKQAKGKLSGPADAAEAIRSADFIELPVSAEHATVAGRLPLLHKDLFDRMLVAQALCEGLTLVTRDPMIHEYDVDLLRI